MTTLRTSAVLLCSALLAAGIGAQTFHVTLDGAQAVPPTGSTATGTATVTLDSVTGNITVSGTFATLGTAATAAQLRGPAPRGVHGPILIALTATGSTSGALSGGGTLTAAQVADLGNSLTYINVLSSGFPGGEIRGQVELDAGDLPSTALAPIGTGALTRIDGIIASATDRDLYWIEVTNPGTFSATTTGTTPATAGDTQLFLFDRHGFGVVHNDDDGGNATSRVTGAMFGTRGPGTYLLAVTRYNCDPTSCGALMWNNTPYTGERAPDGPGAAGPISGWSTGTSLTGTYTIDLVGCDHVSTAVTEIPDAADLPQFAQAPCRSGKLSRINGNNGASDVDMFRIALDGSPFRAATCGLTPWDTMLWLFDSAGNLAAASDDSCGLQSQIDIAAPTAGVYYLAISQYNRAPMGNPVTGWTGTTAGGGPYGIALFGVSYASAATSVDYGVGSGSASGVPTLTSPWPPQLGASVGLTLGNPDPTARAGALVLGLLRTSIPYLGATILVDVHLSFLNFAPVAGNNALPPIAIPANDVLCGQKLTFQALLLVTPGSGFPNGFTLTNGVEWSMGL